MTDIPAAVTPLDLSKPITFKITKVEIKDGNTGPFHDSAPYQVTLYAIPQADHGHSVFGTVRIAVSEETAMKLKIGDKYGFSARM
ncbi:MAG TPA: hypothetical protein VIX19_19795 [Terriglobales bacterium]